MDGWNARGPDLRIYLFPSSVGTRCHVFSAINPSLMVPVALTETIPTLRLPRPAKSRG
jgi:hypothetical protein